MARSLPWIVGVLVLMLLVGGGYLLGTRFAKPASSRTKQAQGASQGTAKLPSAAAGGTSTSAAGTTTTTTPSSTAPESGQGFDAPAAAATVLGLGYRVRSSTPSGYRGPLSVVTGICIGSVDGKCQQAFFFNDNAYIGTATYNSVEQVAISSQSGTSVTLSYPIYLSGDPLCCPSGGAMDYTFTLNPNGTSVTASPNLPQDPNRP